MKKRIIIALAVVVAAIVIYFIVKPPPPPLPPVLKDNVASASYKEINEPEGNKPEGATIYLDASGSMKPYFVSKGANLVNTVSEIKNLDLDRTQIFFLDNPVPYKGLVMNIIGDVSKQPNLTATSFNKFFKDAACCIDTVNTLVYLVTDGIMSVGSAGDTKNALASLRGEIEHALKGHADLAAAIFRYEGEYKGDYWNSRNVRLTSATCPLLRNEIKRPYYVIALGQKGAMRWLQTQTAKLNAPQGTFFMGVHDLAGHGKAVLSKGDNARLETMGLDVTLILDLPECMKDVDAAKVKVMNHGAALPVTVKKEETSGGNRLVAVIPTTVPTTPEGDGKVKITFLVPNEVPAEWIGAWNAEDDTNGPDEKTTFGLATLVTGMFNALEGADVPFLQADFIYKLN